MTTTNQQPPAREPEKGSRSGGLLVGGVVVVVVVLILALGWLFLAGPMSSAGKSERQVEQTLQDMGAADTFAEFNSYLCAANRVPQDLVDTITASGEQTGTDMDSMLRESIAGSFPEEMNVTDVEISGDGTTATATATVESKSGEDQNSEQVQMRQEDGNWKLCEPGVGMGSVPEEGQAG